MKKIALLLPALISITALLFLYMRAAFTVAPEEMLAPLVFIWCVMALLAYPIHRIMRDWNWTAICLALIILAFFYSSLGFQPVAVAFTGGLVIWGACALVSRRFRKMQVLIAIAIMISGVILLYQLQILGNVFLPPPFSVYTYTSAGDPRVELSTPAVKRDIYYIVLDGYGRDDILRDLYGFDNSAFIQFLQSRGFVVLAQAHSNYAKTVLSVTSTLNFEYIDKLAPDMEDNVLWWPISPFIDHNRLRAVLEKQGYETYATATDWDITDNRTVDHYYNPFPLALDDFDGYFLNTTPIGRLQGLLSPFAAIRTYGAHRAFIENSFQSLVRISELPGPKFIFAHILAPHPPFVYDADGNSLTPAYTMSFNDANDYQGDPAEYRRLYIGQVQYVNDRMEKVIDEILTNSSVPPIIVIQADHGPGSMTDFKSAAKTCMRERFSTLAAYYLPGLEADLIPSDMTPVNIFRVVLDRYFDATLPLLENESYFYTGYTDAMHIFRTVSVNSRLNESCPVRDVP